MITMTETIVLGGGCFWCTEAVFQMIEGVVKTTVGYAGGNVASPTSDRVYEGDTGHIEVMKLEYDPKKVDLVKILDVFFTMHDPTSMDRQNYDVGPEYRSAIFYTTDEQKKVVDKFIKDQAKNFPKPIVTQVKKLDKFYPAEDVHQKFFEKNPYSGYCNLIIRPKIDKVKKKFDLK